MFDGVGLLRIAYAVNIIMLIPVCFGMFFGGGALTVFEGMVPASPGLELLVASLWLAILVASFAGLAWPATFATLLLMQIFYKTVWLLAYVIPASDTEGVPWGVASSFVVILLLHPIVLWGSGIWRGGDQLR